MALIQFLFDKTGEEFVYEIGDNDVGDTIRREVAGFFGLNSPDKLQFQDMNAKTPAFKNPDSIIRAARVLADTLPDVNDPNFPEPPPLKVSVFYRGNDFEDDPLSADSTGKVLNMTFEHCTDLPAR
jgi:hypothetical protein